jgi:hypothetical protein
MAPIESRAHLFHLPTCLSLRPLVGAEPTVFGTSLLRPYECFLHDTYGAE